MNALLPPVASPPMGPNVFTMSNQDSLMKLVELFTQCQSMNMSVEEHNRYIKRRSLELTILQESSTKKNTKKKRLLEIDDDLEAQSIEPEKKKRVYNVTIHVGNFGGKLVVKYGMVDKINLQSTVARQIVTSFFTSDEEGKAVMSKWTENTNTTSHDIDGLNERMAYAVAHHEEDAPGLKARMQMCHDFYKPLCEIAEVPEGIQKTRTKGSIPLEPDLKKIHKESQTVIKNLFSQFFMDHDSEELRDWYDDATASFSKDTDEVATLCEKLDDIFESEDYQKLPPQFQKSVVQIIESGE